MVVGERPAAVPVGDNEGGGMTTKWGILGTGWIAEKFAADVALLPDAQVVAVGSRTLHRAQDFAERFGIPHRHESYQALVADADVDAVYVATPHPLHATNALLAIEAGKAVLVEKPFTVDADQARRVVDAARRRGVFVMEAMWTRFLPHMVKIRELVTAGRLGEIRSVTADHGQWFPRDPRHRLFAPELGGGALLDLGVYVVSLASHLFGPPDEVIATSAPAFTGVDAQTAVILRYSGGRMAVLFTTVETRTATWASINGVDARIEIRGPFYAPVSFRLVTRDGNVEEFDLPHVGHGLYYEAAEVGRCLRAGLTESPLMPLTETIQIMEVLDEVRRQIGLRYPWESAGREAVDAAATS